MDDYYPPGPTPNIENLTINNQENIPVSNSVITYKTPCNYIPCIIAGVFCIVGSFVFGLILYTELNKENSNSIFNCFFPLIFVVAGIILGSCISLYNSITIDQIQQLVIIRKRKLIFCFNKTKKIQIGQIIKVIGEIDNSMIYRINNVTYNSFKIIFELGDNSRVIGCEKIINKNNEGQKAITILRNALLFY